jgi:hypothetical protein
MKLELTATWSGERDTEGVVDVSVSCPGYEVHAFKLPSAAFPGATVHGDDDGLTEDQAIVLTLACWLYRVNGLVSKQVRDV